MIFTHLLVPTPKLLYVSCGLTLTQFSEWHHSHYVKLQALEKILLFPLLYLLYLYILKNMLFLSPDQEPLLMRCNSATSGPIKSASWELARDTES